MKEQEISEIGFGHVNVSYSVYDHEIKSKQVELEKSTHTTDKMLLKDIIDTLPAFTRGETNKLTLELCRDKIGRLRIVSKRRLP